MRNIFLWKVGNSVGKTLKVDLHTIRENHHGGEMFITEKGKFARISVELNLNKKLVPRIKIRNIIYRLEYEGLNMICFSCGRYGHLKDQCSVISQTSHSGTQDGHKNILSETDQQPENCDLRNQQANDSTFGSWILVKRNTGKRNEKKQ